jgi:hypothetical protein
MDTEEGFENASFESSEGDTISGSESENESSESSSDSEGGDSPSNAGQETQVPLSQYEADRLKRIERNKKRLEELGLPALASGVGASGHGALKAEKARQPEGPALGRLQVSQQGGVFEENKVTESTISDSPVGSCEYPGAFSCSSCLNLCSYM